MSQLSFLANYAILIFTVIFQSYDSVYCNATGFSLKMIMRDSPESPLYPGNLTERQRLERLVGYTKARLEYLKISNSRNNISVVEPQNEAEMLLLRRQFLYLVNVGLGTPPKWEYLVLDTGGSLGWTQCEPCFRCYPQTVPVYDPTASKSYAKLPCDHAFCSVSGSPFICVNDACVYDIKYLSGERTAGVASRDTLWYRRAENQVGSFPEFIFGCSRTSTGFKYSNSMIGGVLGLSWASHSLASQFSATSIRFSYCLVPFHNNVTTSTTLSLGDSVPTPPRNALATPFVIRRNPGESYFFPKDVYFYLNLIDITVGSERLRLPSGTFGFAGDHEGGFFIDSGAAFSVLAQVGANPYGKVADSFKRQYAALGLKKVSFGGQVDLCYEIGPGFSAFVPMTYHFQGADYFIDGSLTGFPVEGKYFCVALIAGSSKSILGAVHQQNTRFTYDGNAAMLRFYSEQCR